VALSFLTLLPASRNFTPDQRTVSNSRAFYPLVGLLLGLLLVGVELGAARVFPLYLTAAVLLAVMVAITRGLHLDGLMDVCDGLFGGYSPERRLEIMQDPRVGAFGVAGGVTILVVKYGALLSLLDPRFIGGIPRESTILLQLVSPSTPGKALALLLFPVFSRWAMVFALWAFPYVRPGGLGSPFHQGRARATTLAAALTALALGLLLGGFVGLGILAGVTLLAAALGWVMTKALGGLTGDTYGAINEIAEVTVLAAAVALAVRGWLEPLPKLLVVSGE
jgi:adenosylcobinamide-GDP ribazoletransferase